MQWNINLTKWMYEIYRKFNFAFIKITEIIKDISLLEYLVKSDRTE